MIKNQKQASIARERLLELNQALIELRKKEKDLSSAEYTLGVSSLQYLIDEIVADIKEYDALLNGDVNLFHASKLSDINRILISARIAKRMSQKDLADILGIQEQQIQRYEATDYESATWTRIQEVAFALELTVTPYTILLNNRPHFQIPKDQTFEKINKAKMMIRKRGILNCAA